VILQCVAVRCSTLQNVAVQMLVSSAKGDALASDPDYLVGCRRLYFFPDNLSHPFLYRSYNVVKYCSVLQCVALYCIANAGFVFSGLWFRKRCRYFGGVLKGVAVCCSLLQCVVAYKLV